MNSQMTGGRSTIMKCLCSPQKLQEAEVVPSSDSPFTKEYSVSGYSSHVGESEQDTINIEEAESSLRESVGLNFEVGLSNLSLDFI